MAQTEACKCAVCNRIRQTVPKIDPTYADPGISLLPTIGYDHETLLNRFNVDYREYLITLKLHIECEIENRKLNGPRRH